MDHISLFQSVNSTLLSFLCYIFLFCLLAIHLSPIPSLYQLFFSASSLSLSLSVFQLNTYLSIPLSYFSFLKFFFLVYSFTLFLLFHLHPHPLSLSPILYPSTLYLSPIPSLSQLSLCCTSVFLDAPIPVSFALSLSSAFIRNLSNSSPVLINIHSLPPHVYNERPPV